MNIFLTSLVSSAIVLISLFTVVEISERIRYFKKNKNRIDFDKFLKAYDANSSSWDLYSNYVVYACSYYPRSYSSRKNYELYFTYSDLKKYKKWKKQLDKTEAQRCFAETMADIDGALNDKENLKGIELDNQEKQETIDAGEEDPANVYLKYDICPTGEDCGVKAF